ncbi:Lrp/AsnC family transcriptional regulator [Thermococcus sp. 21S9]|uniref:Lrp/AsnC family transcriptional regulator n=1 Tax=Thermococcus sp. 21S9 TaxID=1638223 RepID=UPI00143A2E72|nr:Lrp/AsnC family transcriptional regulator [Thermococcus sp. 21S9]NJE55577.1 Lrp/AsnC family transcriptional regulator [Thermococcus sp. 21S9]
MPGIDEKDREILRILRSNGRITLTELGKRVNLSPASVKSRLEKLERLGAVKGYSAVIDPAFLGNFVRALVFLHFERFDEGLGPMIGDIAKLDNVEFLYIKTGDSQVLIKATFRDTAELEEFLKSLKRKFGRNLKFIEANLVVEELKNCWLADEDASRR